MTHFSITKSGLALLGIIFPLSVSALLLILYGMDILPVNNYDFVDALVGDRFDVFTVLAGVGLIAVVCLLLPWVTKLEKESESVKALTNHHVRNGLQVAIGDLELIEESLRKEPKNISELSSYVAESKMACSKIIDNLEDVTKTKNDVPRISMSEILYSETSFRRSSKSRNRRNFPNLILGKSRKAKLEPHPQS